MPIGDGYFIILRNEYAGDIEYETQILESLGENPVASGPKIIEL